MNRVSRRPWLTRNVKVLSVVSLAQDAASELVYPLLPVLLTGVLGAPAAVVGAVEGIAEGVSAALKYVAGRMSDRLGRRPAILAGYGLAAVGKVIVAAAAVWGVVMVGRVVDRIGKGIRGAPRDALLAEGVPAGHLGKAFGFQRTADNMGAIIGPLIGLAVLTATQVDVRTALWLAVVPALVSVGLVLLVREDRPRERAAPSREPAGHSSLPEEPRGPGGAGGRPGRVGPPLDQRRDGRDDDGGLASPGPDADADEESPRDAHTHRKLPGRARALAAVLGMFALVNFPDALILLRLSDIGLSPASLLGAYALLNLTSTVVSYPAGALADRWARSRVYALGMGCFAAGYLGLGLVDSPGPAVVILLLYGGFAGITEGVSRAWISALAPAAQRGRAQGLLQGLSGVGILVAGLWAGLMWDAGPGDGVVPLLVGGTVAALAAIGLAGPGRRLEPAAAQQAGS